MFSSCLKRVHCIWDYGLLHWLLENRQCNLFETKYVCIFIFALSIIIYLFFILGDPFSKKNSLIAHGSQRIRNLRNAIQIFRKQGNKRYEQLLNNNRHSKQTKNPTKTATIQYDIKYNMASLVRRY